MAAGLGFKTFTTGEVLSAANVNGYLMQGMLVFASAAARDAAITSPQEGQFAYLKDTDTTTYYTGATWTNLVGGVAGGLTLLSTTALTGSSVTVSSISQSYKNLFIYIKDVTSPAVGAVTLRLNGITTSSYTDHRIFYAAAGVQADFTTGTSLFLNNSNSNTAASGKFAALMTIPRYTDTSLIDVDIRSSGRDATAGILVSYNLGRFEAAAAISSVTINHASSFTTGTMYIYGEN
jgi:hypothetical protein